MVPMSAVRTPWQSLLERAWLSRPVIWLMGLRRAGKTTLCRSLPDVVYYDCELPRTRRLMDDLEGFLADHRGKRIVLDEIHRLDQPAELLKIAADHYPDIRIIATGSSTLGASARFRDTLAGRKMNCWLTPMTWADVLAFPTAGRSARELLLHRMLYGGLPGFSVASGQPESAYGDWLDDYWAKDIQELFRLERQHAFAKFLELLLINSGGLFVAERYATPCEVSRTTISNYLSALEATFVMQVVRPFSTNPQAEITSAPKIYGFDTGFMCHARGWTTLRPDDCGSLWEHLVLNELNARFQQVAVKHWRDKQDHEVDFILDRPGQPPIAIECKYTYEAVIPRGLAAFRRRYPSGTNILVCSDVDQPFTRTSGGLTMTVLGLAHLANHPLAPSGLPNGDTARTSVRHDP